MPIVQLHRKLDEVAADIIRSDSRGGAATLTEGLLARGYRRVAFIGGLTTISPARDCLVGYEEALAAAGVAVDPALVRLGRIAPETGQAAMGALLRLAPRPEGVVIGNSRLAVGALRALREAALRVPDDLAVATFHDIAALDHDSRALITAVQPAYDIGRLGTRRLLARLAGLADPPVDLILPNRILVHPSAGLNEQRLAPAAG